MTAVFNVPILPVVTFAFAIVALAVTVAKRTVMVSAEIAFVTVMLFAPMFPVTVTAPNVVVPPLDVEVSANQLLADVVPSRGQTYIVLEFVSYHN